MLEPVIEGQAMEAMHRHERNDTAILTGGSVGLALARDGRRGDRLPWPVAAALIAAMSVGSWLVIWKAGAALLALLG